MSRFFEEIDLDRRQACEDCGMPEVSCRCGEQDLRAARERIKELEEENAALLSKFGEQPRPTQSCGHSVSAIVGSNEGTNYCGECAREQQEGECAGRATWEEGRQKIEMVQVPAGEFIMGLGQEQRRVYVDAFEIATYPLTNAQYKAFLDANAEHSAPYDWENQTFPGGKADHPVVWISWHDAKACAKWYGMRLPTEEEWEKAARGTDGRTYPWGNEFDPKKCNTREDGVGETTPVGSYPEGASPYGVMDMTGNVWEWTSSLYGNGENCPVLRGGSWLFTSDFARFSNRDGLDPDDWDDDVGVRFVRIQGVV